jgi:hypothetical protein
MTARMYVGTRKGLFVLAGGGDRWSVERVDFLGSPVSAVLEDARDGTVYAALALGHFGPKLHRSVDGGRSFDEVACPAYPPGAVTGADPVRGDPVPASVDMIWSLEAAHPDQPGSLWCGTIPGGLFRSVDRGESWRLVEALWDHPSRREWFGGGYDFPGIHSICVDPRRAGDLIVGVSCGGAWRTTDDGATWSVACTGMAARYMPPDRQDDPAIQDPHRIARSPAAPDVLWAQHHNGIFRTTDNAATWHELDVPPSSFGFAVAAHPLDPGVAWFVPAIKDELRVPVDGRFVVTRVAEGGAQTTVLANGLPQEHAYDLVHRHALDVDTTGQVLALGSTTGSLWASADGGASFTTVSTHLPPIACVRFASR